MSELTPSPLAERVRALLADRNLDQGRVDEIVGMVVEAEEARDEELRRALAGEGFDLLRGLHGDERDWRPPGGNFIDE